MVVLPVPLRWPDRTCDRISPTSGFWGRGYSKTVQQKKKTVRKQNGHSSGNPQIIEISGFCCCWYLDFLRGYLSGELKSSLVNLPSLAPPSLMSSTTQARRLASEDGFCATFIETKSRVNEKISGSFVFQVCLIYSYFRHLIPFIRDS